MYPYLPKLLKAVGVLIFIATSTYSQPVNALRTARLKMQLKSAGEDSAKVVLLQRLATYYADLPGEAATDLEQAKILNGQALVLSEKLSYLKGQGISYTILSQILREKGDYAAGKPMAEKAVQVLEKTKLFTATANAYIELSNYYSIDQVGELKEKEKLYSQAVSLIQKTSDRLRYADALKFLGDLHNCQSKYVQSLAELKKALSIYQRIGYTRLQDIYDLLGYVSMQMNHMHEALAYGLLAIQVGERNRDSTMTMCAGYNRLAVTYTELDNHLKSSEYFLKALGIARRLKALDAELPITTNLANEYRRLGRFGVAVTLLQQGLKRCPPDRQEARIILYYCLVNSYIRLQNYDQASRYCTLMLNLAGKTSTSYFTGANVKNSAIELFIKTGKFQKAEKLIRERRSDSKNTTNFTELSQLEKFAAMADSAQGKYLSSLQHFHQYKILEDSLAKRNQAKQVAFLQVQFDSDNKDRNIALKVKNIQLLTKQGLLQKAQLQKASVIRNAVIAGILLLAILLGVIFNRFQIKKRSNKQLLYQQVIINRKNRSLETLVDDKDRLLKDKEWLLKEIHHRVKNNLQIVISLLNTQSANLENGVALAAIQESQHRMRSISLIHEKLYQSEHVATIDMFEYISDLIEYLEESFDINARIEIDLLVEPLSLDVAQAVPLGLILNEAITNCIKYAFKNCQKGKITISLDETAEHYCTLTISDNGCGLPAGYDQARSTSLGMSLMHGLSRQLGGTIQLNSKNGLQVTVGFYNDSFAKIRSASPGKAVNQNA